MSSITTQLNVEPGGEFDTGSCDCCGDYSRQVTGNVWSSEHTIAVYFVHWSIGRIVERGAHVDLILGSWGEAASRKDRMVVRLDHRLLDDAPGVMVIDATLANGLHAVAARALMRKEIIGTPLANRIFEIYDAILAQDARLAPLMGTIER